MAQVKWVYDVSTQKFLEGGYFEPDITMMDSSGQIVEDISKGVVMLLRHPDVEKERYNGAGGIRAATQEEIADTADEKITEEITTVEIWAVISELISDITGESLETVRESLHTKLKTRRSL